MIKTELSIFSFLFLFLYFYKTIGQRIPSRKFKTFTHSSTSVEAVYVCHRCNFESPLDRPLPKCPKCGSPLEISIPRPVSRLGLAGQGVWRYAAFLPPLRHRVTRGEGDTPLIRAKRIGDLWGLKRLYLKDETRNPTGSFVDRGTAISVSAALDFGYNAIFCVGEGDLGASAAAYTAAAGLRCYYKPRGPLDSAKLLQIAVYGAQIVDSEVSNSYYLWPGDPFLLEGYKTLALEVVEALGRAPDAVVVQVGHGSLAYGLWRGFELAKELGIAETVPRFYAAQEATCAPVVRTLEGQDRAREPHVHAGLSSDILITEPVRLSEVISVVRRTHGRGVAVSPSEVLMALRELATKEGLLIDPSAAVGMAALRRLREMGVLDRDELVLVIATGSGLRSHRVLMKIVGQGKVIRSRTKLAILNALSQREMHPYALWRWLLDTGFSLTKQAVYKHLKELEREGLVTSQEKGRKKVYRLTVKGREALASSGSA